MTIIKISKSDKDMLARTCAELTIGCWFYTIENNDQLLQCEIDCDNPTILFGLGKLFGMKVINDTFVK